MRQALLRSGEPSAAPLGAAEFAAQMRPLGAGPLLAAGVSGGPDSLALALLADAWARARGGELLALVVDHGLRAESAAEAAGVVAQLARRGIASRLISLALPAGTRVQERARAARLAALLAACREAGRPWLLLGHQREDQAETVLFRLLRGSGPTGLAGMAAARYWPDAAVLRPLLGIPRARLEATLAAAGLEPVRDPSNADPRFVRARLRAVLDEPGTAALAQAGAAFACRAARADEAVRARLAAAAAWWPEGWCRLDPAALGRDTVAVEALRRALRAVAGAERAPPGAATAALLRRAAGGTASSLAGALLRPGRAGWLLLREPAAVGPAVPALPGTRWDHRFRLLGPGDPGCTVAALGPAPSLRAADLPDAALRAADLPDAALRALPAIRREGTLVAVPALDYPHAAACRPFRLVFEPRGGAAEH